MAWDTVSAPNPASYPSPNPAAVGNALANLVGNYQQAQQGQQRTLSNDLRNQNDQMLLDQSKAFAGGVPMNPDGTVNYAAAMKRLAGLGDANAVAQYAPIIQQQQNIEGANAPDPIFSGSSGGGSSSGGSYKQPSAPAPGPWSSNSFLSTQVGAESEGVNSAVGDGGLAKGDFQFHDATWQRYAKNVPGASEYASAADAPPEVQQAVAETAPISEWGPRTKAILHAKFGAFDDSKTVGELASEFGGKGGGTQVASLGASDAPVGYATSEKPAIPPVSAAAGSSIPRENAPTAAASVGGAPAPAGGGPLAANNPAWAGLNGSLPIGPAGRPAPAPAVGQGAIAPQTQAPRALAPPLSQGSVASIAASAGLSPNVTANIAKAVGAAPDAPLTPQQALKVKAILQSRAQNNPQQAQQQQAPQPVQGQPQPRQGGPIVPQIPLPTDPQTGKPYQDPQQAILAIDRRIADLGRYGSASTDRIRALEDYRERIAKSSAPMDVRPGQTILDPATGQVKYQAPLASSSSPANLALNRFLEEHPGATAEEIQKFQRSGKGGARSGVGQYMQQWMDQHPDATPEEYAKASQDFVAQGSAVTRFDTGKQGDSVRSFNVLVDHLGTLDTASAALKNGNLPLFNRIAQTTAQWSGKPAPVDFDSVKSVVGDELVKAILGGGAALGDREEMKATLDKANSPAQLAGVIDQYKKLAMGQLKGLKKQYESSTGRDDFNDKLAPGTAAFFGVDGDEKSGGGDSKGAPVQGAPGWSVVVH